MKILLIGEYSNVHWTLAEGLRSLGHKVCVVSNGDFWKNYNRDISLVRSSNSKISGISYMIKAYSLLPFLKGYDIVQIINPMFLELKAERIAPFYHRLRKQNKKIFMGAFGMDAFWIKCATAKPYIFRYSDFNIGTTEIDNDYTKAQIADWSETPKARLNKYIADDCNGIIAGMYEYHTAYKELYNNKLTYIPFPIAKEKETATFYTTNRKIRFFIGIQRSRSIYKGTDIMLRALERLRNNYPDDCEIAKAENIPFKEYSQMLNNCDILLDQLYGYSPGMNALTALAKGKIVIGGAEEECYEILGENELRPMINVTPSEEDVYRKMEQLILNKKNIAKLQEESIAYIAKHHDAEKVAKEYLKFWSSK